MDKHAETSEDAIARLRCRVFVELDHLKAMHEWLGDKQQAWQSGRVTGPSRTGKTHNCIAFQAITNRRVDDGDRRPGQPPRRPILYIFPPESCSARALLTEILQELGYAFFRGTVHDLRKRVIEALRTCEVEMIIIDEADRLGRAAFADVRDFSDHRLLHMAVILVGTSSRLSRVLERDEQVRNRFMPGYELGILRGQQLIAVITTWEEHVLKLPQASDLTSAGKLSILTKASRGLIGLLDEILREAAIQALRAGKQRIDVATLRKVASSSSLQ